MSPPNISLMIRRFNFIFFLHFSISGEAARLHSGSTARASSKSFAFPSKTSREAARPTSKPGLPLQISTRTREATEPTYNLNASLENQTSKSDLPLQIIEMSSNALPTSNKHSLIGHISFLSEQNESPSPGAKKIQEGAGQEMERQGTMMLTPV